MKSLNALVNATLVIEKLRVASEVRQSHLKLQGKTDPETDELHKRLVDLEAYVDGRIARLLESHPAYPWFSRVKGIGKENIGKIVGMVRVAPEMRDDTELPYADTISALWKFCGFSVEDGRAPKRVSGEKLSYNSQLRSMCWRLATSLERAGLRHHCGECGVIFGGTDKKTGKPREKCPKCGSANLSLIATTKFTQYLLQQKERYEQRYLNSGRHIVPAAQLPKVNGKKVETTEYISEGHVHNQALRKMIKLFLACLWLEWRKGEGLPLSTPYAIGKLGHSSIIKPEEMVDR
jgi:hypothetical protein